jgi:hypothetical protein
MLKPADIVIFQTVGGHIEGFGVVGRCKFFEFSESLPARAVMSEYGADLKLQPDFIERKKDSSFATLIWFENLVPAVGPQVIKGDRRGWIPLNLKQPATPLL